MGEGINGEWFRVDDENKLYIYLYGAAGCGGCVFNGPYLEIDKNKNSIKGKIANIPYLPNLVLSPSKKFAAEVSLEHDVTGKLESINILLYEFISNKRVKKIFELPKGKTIVGLGDGSYIIDGAVEWIDESTLRIQMYEASEEEGMSGYAKYEGENFAPIKSGEPVMIKI